MLRKQKTLKVNKKVKKDRCPQVNVSPGQWNQILSRVLCVVGFALIFCLMLLFTLVEDVEFRANQNITTNLTGRDDKYSNSSCGLVRVCYIRCIDFDAKTYNLSLAVEDVYDTMEPCTTGNLFLQLYSVKYRDQSLYNGWLNVKFSLNTLEINGGELNEILPYAFDTEVFRNLQKLSIKMVKIKSLKENVFAGLKFLTYLALSDNTIETIEKNSAYPISDTIENLDMEGLSNPVDLENFTGHNIFSRLQVVSFIKSPVYYITNKTFDGLTACQSLYMTSSGIREIHVRAFQKMQSIALIALNDNDLSTLPQNLFTMNKRLHTLYIRDNNWNCDCDLAWFKEFMIENIQSQDPEIAKCMGPDEAFGQKYTDVDFCPEVISTSTILPTTTTVTDSTDETTEFFTTPLLPFSSTEESLYLQCKKFYNEIDRFVYKTNSIIDVHFSRSIYVAEKCVDFSIDDNGMGTVHVNYQLSCGEEKALLWFQGNFSDTSDDGLSSIGCQLAPENGIVLHNLTAGEIYTFCLTIDDDDFTVSPFDCIAHEVNMPWERRTWLSVSSMGSCIGISTLCLVLCTFSGATVIYFLIRKNPTLLRGSKRVVMVKHREAQVVVMPPNFKENPTESAELPEKEKLPSPKFMPINKRKYFRRSVSETSIISSRSATVSYVSAVEPTPVQLLHWRLERLRGGIDKCGPLLEVHNTSPQPSIFSSPVREELNCKDLPYSEMDDCAYVAEIY